MTRTEQEKPRTPAEEAFWMQTHAEGSPLAEHLVKETLRANDRMRAAAEAIKTAFWPPEAGSWYPRPEQAAGHVNDYAEATGRYRLLDRAVWVALNVKDKGGDEAAITAGVERAVLQMLVQGPDDGWSGRTNDARRAEFDGTRKAADETLDEIRYAKAR